MVVEVLRFEDLRGDELASGRVLVRFSDGSGGEALRWDPDELLICEGDLIGKTVRSSGPRTFAGTATGFSRSAAQAARPREGLRKRLAKTAGKRDDDRVEDRESEGERSRKIIRRAKGVRERAAESLRRARMLRKKRGQADAAQKRPRFRRQD